MSVPRAFPEFVMPELHFCGACDIVQAAIITSKAHKVEKTLLRAWIDNKAPPSNVC